MKKLPKRRNSADQPKPAVDPGTGLDSKSLLKQKSSLPKEIRNMLWLKNISMILGAASLLCEFIPDMLNICELFHYFPLVVFLQPHKDFFVNFVMGCFCSAVISYLVLWIPFKIEQEANCSRILDSFTRVRISFLMIKNLILMMSAVKTDQEAQTIENNLNTEMKKLSSGIDSMTDLYGGLSVENEQIQDIFQNYIPKMRTIIDEYQIFSESFEAFKQYQKNYLKDLYRECYQYFYEQVNKKIEWEKIENQLSSLVLITSKMQECFSDLYKEMQNHMNVSSRVADSLNYTHFIYNASCELNEKEYVRIRVKNHLDTMEYGEKVEENQEEYYTVNGKKMTVEEYIDYCVEQELLKQNTKESGE